MKLRCGRAYACAPITSAASPSEAQANERFNPKTVIRARDDSNRVERDCTHDDDDDDDASSPQPWQDKRDLFNQKKLQHTDKQHVINRGEQWSSKRRKHLVFQIEPSSIQSRPHTFQDPTKQVKHICVSKKQTFNNS